MKRILSLVGPLGAVILLIVAVSAWASPSQHRVSGGGGDRGQGRTITVIEHATTDATTDTGAEGDSAGDILTFANDVFDAADAAKVGTDQGSCIRVVVGAAASYECTFTTFLADGQIVVNGPFFDAKDSTLAITGGTGRYRGARGEMELQSRENGAKFAFIFHLGG
jgi:allene oxide cyclase